jgi:hypothetical protein
MVWPNKEELVTGVYKHHTAHKCASRDSEVTGAPRFSDGESAKRKGELVIGFLADTPGARPKLESKQFFA